MNVKGLILAGIVSTTISCQSVKKEGSTFFRLLSGSRRKADRDGLYSGGDQILVVVARSGGG